MNFEPLTDSWGAIGPTLMPPLVIFFCVAFVVIMFVILSTEATKKSVTIVITLGFGALAAFVVSIAASETASDTGKQDAVPALQAQVEEHYGIELSEEQSTELLDETDLATLVAGPEEGSQRFGITTVELGGNEQQIQLAWNEASWMLVEIDNLDEAEIQVDNEDS